MMYIVISGIDGSGKTTIIAEIQKYFLKRGVPTFYVWMRFNHYLCKAMHALARILRLSIRKPSYRGTAWFHEFYRSELFCSIYIIMTYLDTLIGCFKLRLILIGNKNPVKYVICDRWIPDVLVDLGVKTHDAFFLETAWYKRFMRLIPSNSKLFLISRNIGEVLNCRQENREDPDFSFRTHLYERLQQKKEMSLIVNIYSIDACVNSILKIVNHEET